MYSRSPLVFYLHDQLCCIRFKDDGFFFGLSVDRVLLSLTTSVTTTTTTTTTMKVFAVLALTLFSGK